MRAVSLAPQVLFVKCGRSPFAAFFVGRSLVRSDNSKLFIKNKESAREKGIYLIKRAKSDDELEKKTGSSIFQGGKTQTEKKKQYHWDILLEKDEAQYKNVCGNRTS